MSTRELVDETRSDYSCFNVVHLATARAAELAAFEAEVNVTTAHAITCLQRLPVRLRRRAASHRVNRLPRRLHRHFQQPLKNNKGQLVAAQPKRAKLKSRRYRRRHLRLLAMATRIAATSSGYSELNSNRKTLWLPTHLWHAKRYHMINIWGWRLPQAPNDKIFKACQDAALNGCLVFDLSYWNCFELTGTELTLASCLKSVSRVCPTFTQCSVPLSTNGTPEVPCEQPGLLFADVRAEGILDITRPVLGPVRILWGPRNEPHEGHRRVYVWNHPEMSADAWQLLVSCSQIEGICIRNLTGRVSRLCTLGRQSHQLLADVFSPQNPDLGVGDWKLWEEITKRTRQASCLPLGAVLFLSNCTEFRENRPALKIRNRDWIVAPAGSQEQSSETTHLSPSGAKLSWSDLSCIGPTKSGNFSDFFDDTGTVGSSNSKGVNVILVQNATPSILTNNPNSVGWDVILIRSRAMDHLAEIPNLREALSVRDLLIACVYRGAEVGGLREWQYWSTVQTQGNGWLASYPYFLWPDTPGGRKSDEEMSTERQQVFSRRPPNLRPDYTRMGTPNPFHIPWSELISDNLPSGYLDTKCTYFVLRDPCFLRLVVQRMISGDPRARLTLDQLVAHHSNLPFALVPVQVDVIGRGIPKPCAILYCPIDEQDFLDTSKTDNARKQESPKATRSVLGYVQTGGFNYSLGRATGLAFISLAALVRTIHSSDARLTTHGLTRMLMKNTRTLRLRPVRISVLL
ncbi:hypothetical protein CRM22_003001 [Opisthorchis felineus]|uniref:Uncharacterized protein n=1 Tax=Opisthorchis felineus TaxID=147828 RepID=A0A4S2M9I2_OPIFE|nr:hypothetical protein CRM22_003001 [Opisthorchis felineus]